MKNLKLDYKISIDFDRTDKMPVKDYDKVSNALLQIKETIIVLLLKNELSADRAFKVRMLLIMLEEYNSSIKPESNENR
jgi:hypothetical protein